MEIQALQNDKHIPINLPEICAPRPELLGHFDKAAEKRYIYVNAPGGCGKTVSTLLWIQKSGHTPIWLGLDTYDNTPSVFYRFFCTSLFSAIPQKENLLEVIMASVFNDSPVEYTVDILSRFSFDRRKYALVLDDFYFITHGEILKSLVHILKRLPLSVTVIILSRSGLPSYFEPLNQNGKIAFITASQLAFKSSEIRRFFSGHGRFITGEESDQVFSLTDGWAIAVSALALTGKINAAHKLEGDLLEDYIKTQLWDKLAVDLRLFLIKTSIVDEFSIKFSERLTQHTDAGQILTMLCSENLFISRQNDIFRYHHLFLNFLRGQAQKETAVEYESLYQKAADDYFEEGNYFDALRYYVRTRDKMGTAVALHRFWNSTGKSSAELSKIAFINELPADFLEQNPYLYIGCAWYNLFYSNIKNFFFYMDKLYQRIEDIVHQYPMFLESMLFLFTIDHRYTFTQQAARLPSADTLAICEQNVPRSQCQYFPFFYRTHRDYSYCAINTEMHFAEFRLVFSKMLGSYYPIIEAGVRSGILYERNQLKEALLLVNPDPATDSDELIFLSKIHISSCLFAMAREEDAARYRADIKAFLEKRNLLYLLPVFSAYETKIALQDGNKAAAATWLENYFVNDGQEMELHKIYLHFTTARAYIVLGEYKKAQLLCQEIKALSRDFGRLLDEIEATVLLAVIEWNSGKKQDAVEMFQAALASAEPYYFIRVFAEEGKSILPIINRLRKKISTGNTPALDHKYVHEIYQVAYEHSKRHRGIVCTGNKTIKLSKQQKLILELLAKGYKNAEIVEKTGLSLNTIRSHTKIAYQKLEVCTASDAVLRARELELIG